jgi:hypothetical protein
VPTLVRAAAIGALAWAPLACGDDGNGTTESNSSDQFPTDPCVHGGTGGGPECESDSQMTNDPSESGFDSFPTIPCAHDPDSCESTGIDTGTTTGTSGSASDTDTDTNGTTETGSGTAGDSSSSGTGATTSG